MSLDLIFAPTVAEMYPARLTTKIEVGGPSAGMETKFRPRFFGGVATIVGKLLVAAMPDLAVFGEKDYQQLVVIRRLMADLGLPTEIIEAPIARKPTVWQCPRATLVSSLLIASLPASSILYLKDAIAAVRAGEDIASAEARGAMDLLATGFNTVDYVTVRDAARLEKIEHLDRPARALAAVKIGGTRLIDKLAI